MAIKIKLKNSVTQDAVPTGTHLPEVGELAVNANINSIGGYMRASDNSIVKIFGPGSVSTPAASTTVSGIAELATSAETTTGTDTARVCTPAGVKAVTDAERTTSNSTYLALAGGTLTNPLILPNASNSAPALTGADTDSGVYFATNSVSLAAGGTARLTADTGVSVVGALAVTGTITSTDDLTIPDKIIHSGDTDTAIRFPAANTVSVESGGSEALRVDSSQRLLVGLTSARTLFSGYTPSLQVEGTGNSDSSVTFISNKNSNESPSLWFAKSRGADLGGVTIVQDSDELGSIWFNGADGTDIQSIGASIIGRASGTIAGNRMPGELLFGTTSDSPGAVAPTTRLRIGSDGISTFAGNVVIDNAKQIRFSEADSNGANYVSLQAPDALAADVSYTLPSAAPTANGQVLASTTGGVLSWTEDPTGQWITNSTNLYYDSGNVGIGAGNTPSEKLTVQGGKIQIEHTACDLLFMETGTTDTNHRIRQNFGNLYIQKLNDAKDTAVTGIVIDGAGHVELHHSGSKKVETTSTGATVSGLLTTTGNLRVNGSPAWAETGGDYGNLSIRGTTASSSGFINLGNGAAATNSEFDLARIKIHNGATEVARITGITGDGNNDSGELWFATQANGGSLTTALVIDKDGNCGIGTTGPTSLLELNAANDTAQLKFLRTGTTIGGTINTRDESNSKGLTYTAQDANSAVPQHVWQTNNGSAISERMRLDHNGKLLLRTGTTASSTLNGGFESALQVEGTSASDSSISLVRNSDNAHPPYLMFGKSRGAAPGSNGNTSNGDGLGSINWHAADGSDAYNAAASIRGYLDHYSGNSDSPGRLSFWTTPDGSTAPLERLTIKNGGDVQVQTGNVQISTSGKGIMFHPFDATATTNGSDSNLLSDYEEGTFEAHLVGYDADNSNTWENVTFQSLQSRHGTYVKIGNMVHVQIAMWVFEVDTKFSGTLAGVNLPFAAKPNSESGYSVLTYAHGQAMNLEGEAFYTQPNQARAYSVVTGGTSYNTWNGASGRYLMVSGTYLTD